MQNNISETIQSILSRHFGASPGEATKEQMYMATAISVKDILSKYRNDYKTLVKQKGGKRVYYLCMEFLLGASLKTNLCNLQLLEEYRNALEQMGFNLQEIFDLEPDAGLGNGGLGRLAACFMDSLSTLGYPATGFSICYEYGLFKQKIVDGLQVELPDNWLPGGDVWLVPRNDRTFTINFGGRIKESWCENGCDIIYEDSEQVEAVAYDMMISGANSKAVSLLRLWKARNPVNFDMSLFTQGQYMKAMEESSNAELISKMLYPADNHTEGKLLRLTQQYFLVSASCQSIIRDHMAVYGTLDNFSQKVAIHINDTHPALVVPELMRIFLDVYRFSWERAWETVTNVVSYTNHTVMPEALESWNEDLFRLKLPRIHMIVKEINQRFCAKAWELYPGDWGKISYMAPLCNNTVKMANLSIIASHHVNGVSCLHSDILKKNVFHDFYTMTPQKFGNVTNGIAHRRWLVYSNPSLAALLDECIGPDYRYDSSLLKNFKEFENNHDVLNQLSSIKHQNKIAFSNMYMDKANIKIDPDTVFDVQIKRLHEYKRQLLCALRIITLYNDLCENPDLDIPPQTFIFGAKAAPGYAVAKQIIKLIWFIGKDIRKNPKISSKLNVVFMENYNVSLAEKLIPASEISEQISLAGKEASGTSNMKFMINGALTIGTLDGANVEMQREVGNDNIFIFGLRADEVSDIWSKGYNAYSYYSGNDKLRKVIERLNSGFDGQSFSNIANYLIMGGHGVADPFMCLADYESYMMCHDKLNALYANKTEWNKISLNNIAGAGYFSADRAIKEYAENIWHLTKI